MINYKYYRYFSLIIAFCVFIFLIQHILFNSSTEGFLQEEKIEVMVTILPLAYFVEQIGKDKVIVNVMIPPGANPHIFEPLPSQLKEVSQAQLYVKIGSGLDFELAWMEKIKDINKNMLICDSSQGIELINRDPHIWLSLKNAKIIAQNIFKSLIQVDPLNQEYFEKNKIEFLNCVITLDEEIKEKFSRIKNNRFISYHSSWSYLAKDYNLVQIVIEDEGKEPGVASLIDIIKQARAHNISIITVSPQFNFRSAKVIAQEIGAQIIINDPLSQDYLRNLQEFANQLVDGVSK